MKKQYKIIIMLFIVGCSFITILNYSGEFDNGYANVFDFFHRSSIYKKLVVGRASDAITLDPSNMTDIDSIKVTANIFETLVKYEMEGKNIKPGLAVDWKCSEDGLTWVFKLRQGVKFHDETDFNGI